MYRVIDDRASGKTGRLMLLAKESEGTIICSNPRAMTQKARAYGITGINFMSYGDFLTSSGLSIDNYYIDELEAFIQYAQRHVGITGNFNGYTISKE